ncbi:unnamed protein product, partial [marine sediment metagenome]
MADSSKYGWTYEIFHAAVGWDRGTQTVYESWENFWSRKIDAYIFIDSGVCPRITDANESAKLGDIVNEMMVQTNLYLKAAATSSPMETGFYMGPGFPRFKGDPKGRGTEHYALLNMY